jgi:uncharacterized protein (DUF362 family)
MGPSSSTGSTEYYVTHPIGLKDNRVFCSLVPGKTYGFNAIARYSELPRWANPTASLAAIRSLFLNAGLDHSRRNSPDWNPLADVIAEGQKVVVKPNWVHHENGSGRGLECLVTHTSVLEAILHYVMKARPTSLVIGDAPIQGCDFSKLLDAVGVPEVVERFSRNGFKVGIKDFRRTIHPDGRLRSAPVQDCRPLNDFILYDLGVDSALEEISSSDSEFRVTMYDPRLLKRTHGPGRHQYLVARDIIDADVVINVPKLKTHKKACITGALKNIVGINGHKEYLPHHRKGGSNSGGDCYPESSYVKSIVETLLDAANEARGGISRSLLAGAVRAGVAFGKLVGRDNNYDGSWFGNDTVWRMALDLQRILHYGRKDGSLAELPQRKVLTVTDAIIAGEGEGPLAPTPVNLGVVTFGANAPAVEWVNALLMGISPDAVPITRESFAPSRYPLAQFNSKDVKVRVDGLPVDCDALSRRYGQSFRLPVGWKSSFRNSSVNLGIVPAHV